MIGQHVPCGCRVVCCHSCESMHVAMTCNPSHSLRRMQKGMAKHTMPTGVDSNGHGEELLPKQTILTEACCELPAVLINRFSNVSTPPHLRSRHASSTPCSWLSRSGSSLSSPPSPLALPTPPLALEEPAAAPLYVGSNTHTWTDFTTLALTSGVFRPQHWTVCSRSPHRRMLGRSPARVSHKRHASDTIKPIMVYT